MAKRYRHVWVPEELRKRIKTRASLEGKPIGKYLEDVVPPLSPDLQDNDKKKKGKGGVGFDIGF